MTCNAGHPERLHSARDAARQLGISERTISSWKARGRVIPADFIAGRGRGGVVPLYRLEDLRQLRDQAATRRSRR